MDAPSVQSGSKCGGSDFSIERILGDRKDSREESVAAPEWLCCTRYRPPRLPRAATVCRARRAGRHARVPFTAAQAAALEAAYARAPYLAPPALKALAAALQLRDDRIKIWFQNRRARERREKSITIAPPQGIALPPTTLTGGLPTTVWIPQPNFSISRSAIINTQRFCDPRNSVASAKSNSADLISVNQFQTQRYNLPFNCEEKIDGSRYDSREENGDIEVRPSTPLDVETVDD